jgi:hypothetical protein
MFSSILINTELCKNVLCSHETFCPLFQINHHSATSRSAVWVAREILTELLNSAGNFANEKLLPFISHSSKIPK